jgi:hypothetical protein
MIRWFMRITKKQQTKGSKRPARRSVPSAKNDRQHTFKKPIRLPPVGEAVDPTRQPWPGMPMGVDVGMDITGNPGRTPNANAGGPSSTENIVGTGRAGQGVRTRTKKGR